MSQRSSKPKPAPSAAPADAAKLDSYVEVTQEIRVTVRSYYMADKSDPSAGNFFWAYMIKIENLGRETVQLLKRTWEIVDSLGRMKRVHGDGVVGFKPTLEPGEQFEYTSGTPLETSSGFMGGLYHMVYPASGENFDIRIPSFSLDSPQQARQLH